MFVVVVADVDMFAPVSAADATYPAAPGIDNEPVDSWDADDETLITPEDEEMDVDGDDDEIALKIIKKKPPKVEESKSKKEHVNVVFIGHVGAYYSSTHPSYLSNPPPN